MQSQVYATEWRPKKKHNVHEPTISDCAPKCKRRISRYPPWINGDLAKAIRKKKTLWKQTKRSDDMALKEKFRKERQRIKNWIRLERTLYFNDLANNAVAKPKKFWSFFSFKTRANRLPDTMMYQGISISDDTKKAESFQRFFDSIYTDHSSCSTSHEVTVNPLINNRLDLIVVTTEEVTKLLTSLDSSKAPGPDNLPAIVLKKCTNTLAPSITAFINSSFLNGYCLSAWKTANICPVHKKDKKTEVENYRPISLMPILAKVQERCVLNRLLPHISPCLFNMQHGFLKGLSCTTQLLQVLHELGRALDSGLETDVIYLDFSKAFDSVCHAKLLSKLYTFGIDGPLLQWFTSYLSGRQQRVVVNGSFSSWGVAKSGVPQGSILGPVLFLMFVNDMPDVLKSSSLAMYADDSKCYKTIKTMSDICDLQDDLNFLCVWSASNELYFQHTKCHNLRISRKKTSSPRVYNLNNTELKLVMKEKDLGLTVTKDLSWNEHITQTVSKTNKLLGFIKRHCYTVRNKNTLTLLYTSLIRSHFCFASQVWAPQSVIKNLLLIERTQRRATKFICNDRNMNYQIRLVHLNLLPLNYWLEY